MNNNTNKYMLFHCKSCYITYDGFAQCCFEMDHIIIDSYDDIPKIMNKEECVKTSSSS